MKKLYMVTDLGPGDGGKGGVVHKLAHQFDAHTIVKVGGAQGSHGVRTANGDSFAFSQFGCGTFEGVRTHISKRFVTNPVALMAEAAELQKIGVSDPLSLLTVTEDSLCSTIFHMAASQLTELLWRDNPRGTIGSGVGQAYRLNESHPELSIHMRDLEQPGLRDRLAAIQAHYRMQFNSVFTDLDQFLMKDLSAVAEVISILKNEAWIDATHELLCEAAAELHIVPDWYLGETVLQQAGVVVSESSHGILTDTYTGFHPHTSALRTLPRFIRGMYEDAGYDGEIVSLGVHRAYSIRHGAGPLPTHSEEMGELLLPGSNKLENRWQGKVRVGPLDLVLLRYALAASGSGAYDGLAITWFDQIQKIGEWQLCNRYICKPQDQHQFTTGRDQTIKLIPSYSPKCEMTEEEYWSLCQGALTQTMNRVTPQIKSEPLKVDASQDELYELVADTLLKRLGVPVRMISFGPTERDKVLK